MNNSPVKAPDFTLSQAQLVIHCRDAYDVDHVKRAAIWMLGCLSAPPDDIRLATQLVALICV
jgi:hypothetical protein